MISKSKIVYIFLVYTFIQLSPPRLAMAQDDSGSFAATEDTWYQGVNANSSAPSANYSTSTSYSSTSYSSSPYPVYYKKTITPIYHSYQSYQPQNTYTDNSQSQIQAINNLTNSVLDLVSKIKADDQKQANFDLNVVKQGGTIYTNYSNDMGLLGFEETRLKDHFNDDQKKFNSLKDDSAEMMQNQADKLSSLGPKSALGSLIDMACMGKKASGTSNFEAASVYMASGYDANDYGSPDSSCVAGNWKQIQDTEKQIKLDKIKAMTTVVQKKITVYLDQEKKIKKMQDQEKTIKQSADYWKGLINFLSSLPRSNGSAVSNGSNSTDNQDVENDQEDLLAEAKKRETEAEKEQMEVDAFIKKGETQLDGEKQNIKGQLAALGGASDNPNDVDAAQKMFPDSN